MERSSAQKSNEISANRKKEDPKDDAKKSGF